MSQDKRRTSPLPKSRLNIDDDDDDGDDGDDDGDAGDGDDGHSDGRAC